MKKLIDKKNWTYDDCLLAIMVVGMIAITVVLIASNTGTTELETVHVYENGCEYQVDSRSLELFYVCDYEKIKGGN